MGGVLVFEGGGGGYPKGLQSHVIAHILALKS